MKKIYLIILTLVLSLSSFGQDNKLTHKFSDYSFSINIDKKIWRKVTYAELKLGYKKNNLDFDKILDNQNYEALFLYKKIGNKEFIYDSPITVEIYKIDSSKKNFANVYDTIESKNPFLIKMESSQIDKDKIKYYYDKSTSSIILKYVGLFTKMQYGNKFEKPQESIKHFVIEQNKFVGNYRILIRYVCTIPNEKEYFPYFENIIRSLN